MAKYFKRPFAETGLKTPIPVDTTLDNSVSYETGWTTDYEIDPVADPVNAKYPELRNFNQLFYNLTENIKEWQEQTFPDWISDDGSGSPFAYSKDAIVRYTDGKNYVSLVDSNDGEPTVSANWEEFNFVNFVTLDGNQSVSGVKTFDSSPVVPTLTTGDNSTKTANSAFVVNSINDTALGVGQTWQNVTASRAMGVTYTNTTGKPIFVIVCLKNSVTTGIGTSTLTVGGVSKTKSIYVGAVSNAYGLEWCFPVQDGVTYSVTNDAGMAGTGYYWLELR